jgi:predicted CXXCH cytochrome family protein
MMRRAAMIPAAAVFLCVGLSALALGGVEGSKHDFSEEPWADGDSCVVCHTPYRDGAPVEPPLWDPEADLSRTFGDSVRQTESGWRGTTMCLSCHDGTIAEQAIIGVPRTRQMHKDHPAIFSAAHDSTDHPVGVEYPQHGQDFRPITSVISKGTVILPDGRVECVSCHDPHGASGAAHMLVADNARSALCLTCHEK